MIQKKRELYECPEQNRSKDIKETYTGANREIKRRKRRLKKEWRERKKKERES